MSNYWKLAPYIRPQSGTIALALCCTLVFTACWPVLAWLSKWVAQSVGEGNVSEIARLAAVAATIFLIQKIAQYGQDSLMAKAALAIAYNLRTRLYAHLQRLNIDYFESSKTGDLSYRLTEDVDRVGEVVQKIFHQFIPCVLQVIVVLGYVIYLNWQLTLATFIIAPLMAVLIGWFGEQMRKFSLRSQSRISNLSALLVERFAGMRAIKAFAAEESAIAVFNREAESHRRIKYATEKLKAVQFPVIGFLQALCVLLLFLLGGWQISRGNLSGSSFVSYCVGVAMLIDPIAITTNNYNEVKQGEASVDRIFELFATQPTIIETVGAKELPPVMGKVEYCNVNFTYPAATYFASIDDEDTPANSRPLESSFQGKTPTLQNINFLVHPGETIALVGASGAGKSTLLNLLPRFYDPDAGEILIDGIKIRDVTLPSLRRKIGIVPQETILFSGTIAENIAFGQENFDLAAVEAAAKVANAHQFISQFSQGYYTYVGERGANLSGGQRQRIAIARAVFLNPQILILDEATSALDSESEALVQEALERIMRDRTVFVIAHRLATVRRSDRLFVLEKGQIVEAGTHAELLEKNGRYAQFYAQQFDRES
ncbi:ABC transporter ATP-binding protein [Oscillatoria sp. FACHB-1406]|uniref:ABC transporter ATP-binding protein n=1 Tax=Oscillatoria sp. FACHB-1406 TaxID=2692846 RepID=UPI001685A8AD|nr:ABC transporter ATP-binding protein [Oscillatoria sp. FACHB-1406]MBD2576389.1 ABC transporter ATP-binding protein [Oscillatoria sp. FACHB-1406]